MGFSNKFVSKIQSNVNTSSPSSLSARRAAIPQRLNKKVLKINHQLSQRKRI